MHKWVLQLTWRAQNALVVPNILMSSLKNANLLLQWMKSCPWYEENELVVGHIVISSLNNADLLFLGSYDETGNGSGSWIQFINYRNVSNISVGRRERERTKKREKEKERTKKEGRGSLEKKVRKGEGGGRRREAGAFLEKQIDGCWLTKNYLEVGVAIAFWGK